MTLDLSRDGATGCHHLFRHVRIALNLVRMPTARIAEVWQVAFMAHAHFTAPQRQALRAWWSRCTDHTLKSPNSSKVIALPYRNTYMTSTHETCRYQTVNTSISQLILSRQINKITENPCIAVNWFPHGRPFTSFRRPPSVDLGPTGTSFRRWGSASTALGFIHASILRRRIRGLRRLIAELLIGI